MRCEEKGFIVEVAGIDHPATPPFILSTSPEETGLQWCQFIPSHSQQSPHTLYAADFTEDRAKSADWKLYLQVPGLEKPLQVAPYNEKESQTHTGVLPTGYKQGSDAFQDYIFIPFRPVTSIIASGQNQFVGQYHYWGCNEKGGQTFSGEDDAATIKCHLRMLRKGFLYIFRGGKLWREIMVFEDGTFTDVDLEKERLKHPDQRPQLEGGNATPQKGLAEEIWLPFRIGPQKGASTSGYSLIDYRIAYSEKQWTWAYIDWLEKAEKHCHTRMARLGPLSWKYTEKTRDSDIPPRFASLIKETTPEGKFFPVEGRRASLLTEAVGQASALVRSAKWKRAAEEDEHNPFVDILADWTAFKKIHNGEIPPEYDPLEMKSNADPAKKVFGPGVKSGRGLFYVHDNLYSPLFHSARVIFYFNFLKRLDFLLIDKPYVATIWQMLDSLRYRQDDYGRLTANLDMHKVNGCILPAHRAAVREMIKECLRDLQYCVQDAVSGDSDLPGSLIDGDGSRRGIRSSLHDLFTLEGAAYVAGWSWVKNIATALLTDFDTADSCYIPPQRRHGLKGYLQSNSESLISTIENWDCNGITLREMLYPDPFKYPVDKPLVNSVALTNDGSGQCRFEELRSAISGETETEVRAHLYSIVTGVGTIFYQKYLEDILNGRDSFPQLLTCHEKLEYTVNLLRVPSGMEGMVLSCPDILNARSQRILIKGLSYLDSPQNHTPQKSYVRKRGKDGKDDTFVEHVIYPVTVDKFVVSRAKRNKSAAKYPLLVAAEGSPTLHLWGVSADLAAQARIELNMLFIVISSMNLVVAREAWLAGNSSDGLVMALKTTDSFVKIITGILTGVTFRQALKMGSSVATLVGAGATLAARTLGAFLSIGNIIGAVDCGVSTGKALDQGDTTAAVFYGGGAMAFSIGIAWTVVGIVTGVGFIAGPAALGILGVGSGALGSFFESPKLEIELRQSNYGILPQPRVPANDDDNVFRLLRIACPVYAETFNPKDMQSEHYAHIRAMGIEKDCLKRNAIRIKWPMFAQPFERWQINYPYGGVTKALYIEDRHEILLFTDREVREIIIWHEGDHFAYIQEEFSVKGVGIHYPKAIN